MAYATSGSWATDAKLGDANERRTRMEQRITPQELRDAARFVNEEILAQIDELSYVAFPLVAGGAKGFPRPAPEDRAAQQGAEVLREEAEKAAAALYALAVASENDLPISEVLFASVQPFVDAFEAAEQQATSENVRNQTEENTTTQE
jgi:hypothetical protein